MPGIWEHDEMQSGEIEFVKASKTKRFVNFVIDYIVLLFVVTFFFGVMAFMGDTWFESTAKYAEGFMGRLLMTLFYGIFYLLIETSLRGKSIGKIVTGTRVVTLKGEEPQFEDFLKRSFSRIVPFEPLSYLGERDGWHDRWSDTMVIDEKLSSWPEDHVEYEY